MIGRVEQADVCDAVVLVVRNRGQEFTWHSHDAAAELIGNLQCPDSESSLREFGEALGMSPDGENRPASEVAAEYRKVVLATDVVTGDSIRELRRTVRRALESLARLE
jgi:hypothetical protein